MMTITRQYENEVLFWLTRSWPQEPSPILQKALALVDPARQQRIIDTVIERASTGTAPHPLPLPAHGYGESSSQGKTVVGRSAKGGPGSGFYGHAGRPGEVGGSAPRSTQAGDGSIAPPRYDDYFPQQKYIGSPITAAPMVWGEDNTLPEEVDTSADPEGMIGFGKYFTDDAGLTDDKINARISELSGVDKADVKATILQWNKTTSDHDMRSLMIQKWGAEEFGVDTSEFLDDRIDEVHKGGVEFFRDYDPHVKYDDMGPDPDSFNPLRYQGMSAEHATKKMLRAMYNTTQEQLKDAGVDKVVLYRGFREPPGDWRTKYFIGDTFNPDENPISSWTLSKNIAEMFAYDSSSPSSSQAGYVLKAVVPANRILSTWKTGLGVRDEWEVSVLKSSLPDTAVVYDIRDIDASYADVLSDGGYNDDEIKNMIVNPDIWPENAYKATGAGPRTIFLDDDTNADWLRIVGALRVMSGKGQPVKSGEWDESKHPRHGAGTPEGGEFAPKDTPDQGALDGESSLQYDSYGGSPITAPDVEWGKGGLNVPLVPAMDVMHNPIYDFYYDPDESDQLEKVRQELADAVGSPYFDEWDVDDLIAEWESDTTKTPKALLIQKWASEVFGVEPGELLADRLQSDPPGVKDVFPDNPQAEKDVKAFLRAMYERTQAEFAANNITEIAVYRGFTSKKGDSRLRLGDKVDPDTNPLSSWSFSEKTANFFANGESELANDAADGYVFMSIVPANRVLSVWATGFGMKREAEVVLLKSGQHDEAVVKSMTGIPPEAYYQTKFPDKYANPDILPKSASKSVGADLRTIFLDDDANADWLRIVGALRTMIGKGQPVKASDWDESKHPRHGAGTSEGGQFAPKGTPDQGTLDGGERPDLSSAHDDSQPGGSAQAGSDSTWTPQPIDPFYYSLLSPQEKFSSDMVEMTHAEIEKVREGIRNGDSRVTLVGSTDVLPNYHLDDETVQSMFEIDGLSANVDVSLIDDPNAMTGRPTMLELNVDWKNDAGEDVGQSKWHFRSEALYRKLHESSMWRDRMAGRDPKPYNNRHLDARFEWLSFKDGYIERGVAEQMVHRQLQILKDAGYKRVELFADATIGKYSWAKEGAEYENSDDAKYASKRFVRWAQSKNIDEPPSGWPQFKNVYEVATYEDPGGVTLYGSDIRNKAVADDYRMPLGKAFMLDSSVTDDKGRGYGHGAWDAFFNLNKLGHPELLYHHSGKSASRIFVTHVVGDTKGTDLSDHAFWAQYLEDGEGIEVPVPQSAKGGPGSGNFGHVGRPPLEGGSGPGKWPAGGIGDVAIDNAVEIGRALRSYGFEIGVLLGNDGRVIFHTSDGKIANISFARAQQKKMDRNVLVHNHPTAKRHGIPVMNTFSAKDIIVMCDHNLRAMMAVTARGVSIMSSNRDLTPRDKKTLIDAFTRESNRQIGLLRLKVNSGRITVEDANRAMYDAVDYDAWAKAAALVEGVTYSHYDWDDVDDPSAMKMRRSRKGWAAALDKHYADNDIPVLGAGSSTKGGPGSGNFGHAGRPGHVGGSASRLADLQSDELSPQLDQRVKEVSRQMRDLAYEVGIVMDENGSVVDRATQYSDRRVVVDSDFRGKIVIHNHPAYAHMMSVDDLPTFSAFNDVDFEAIVGNGAAGMIVPTSKYLYIMKVAAPLTKRATNSILKTARELMQDMALMLHDEIIDGSLSVEDADRKLQNNGWHAVWSVIADESPLISYQRMVWPDRASISVDADVDTVNVDRGAWETIKGGAGSGNFGHAGRPGRIGGSTSRHIGRYDISSVDGTTEGDVPEWAKIGAAAQRIDKRLFGLKAKFDKYMRIVQDNIEEYNDDHPGGPPVYAIDKNTFDGLVAAPLAKANRIAAEFNDVWFAEVRKAIAGRSVADSPLIFTVGPEGSPITNIATGIFDRWASVVPSALINSRLREVGEINMYAKKTFSIPQSIDNGAFLAVPEAYVNGPILWHELTHGLEGTRGNSRDLLERSLEFVRSRATSSTPIPMSELYDEGTSASGEAYPGDYITPYVGKVFSDGLHTEVFTVGMEEMRRNAFRFYQKDRGHFLFVLDALTREY